MRSPSKTLSKKPQIRRQIIYTHSHLHPLDLFKRKSKTTTNLECKICHLKFSDPERTMRHMAKAHSKPQKKKRGIGTGKYA